MQFAPFYFHSGQLSQRRETRDVITADTRFSHHQSETRSSSLQPLLFSTLLFLVAPLLLTLNLTHVQNCAGGGLTGIRMKQKESLSKHSTSSRDTSDSCEYTFSLDILSLLSLLALAFSCIDSSLLPPPPPTLSLAAAPANEKPLGCVKNELPDAPVNDPPSFLFAFHCPCSKRRVSP